MPGVHRARLAANLERDRARPPRNNCLGCSLRRYREQIEAVPIQPVRSAKNLVGVHVVLHADQIHHRRRTNLVTAAAKVAPIGISKPETLGSWLEPPLR
jgi:hypothetical protein